MGAHDYGRSIGLVTLPDLQQTAFDRNPSWRESFTAQQINWAVQAAWYSEGMTPFALITRTELARIEDRAEQLLLDIEQLLTDGDA